MKIKQFESTQEYEDYISQTPLSSPSLYVIKDSKSVGYNGVYTSNNGVGYVMDNMFDTSKTEEQAMQSSENKVFLSSDKNSIVINGTVYGRGGELGNIFDFESDANDTSDWDTGKLYLVPTQNDGELDVYAYEDSTWSNKGSLALSVPLTAGDIYYDRSATCIKTMSKTGNGSAYITTGLINPALSPNTTYKVVVTTSLEAESNYTVRGLVDNTPKITFGTFSEGELEHEFSFNTGEFAINHFQVTCRDNTWTFKIYRDNTGMLDEKINSIDDMITQMEQETHDYLDNGFQVYSGLSTKTNADGTHYPWSPLPHIVRKGLYCKLEITNISATKAITVRLMKPNGTKAFQTIGKIPAGATEMTFYFTPNGEFKQIQYMTTGVTTSTSRLYVMSDFYRDSHEYHKYMLRNMNYKSGLKCIAHQGFSEDQYINGCRKSAIIAAARNHFDGVEVDIIFSSDNVPFLSHDDTFSSGGNTITIANETAENLINYTYLGEKLCSFEEAISVCKDLGMDMILDHTTKIVNQEQADNVVDILNKYKAWKNVIWTTSSSFLSKSKILSLYPQARVIIAQHSELKSSNITNANTAAQNGQNVVLSFNYEANPLSTALPLLAQLDPRVEVSAYTFDTQSSNDTLANCDERLLSYAPYVNYILSGCTNKFIAETGYLDLCDRT